MFYRPEGEVVLRQRSCSCPSYVKSEYFTLCMLCVTTRLNPRLTIQVSGADGTLESIQQCNANLEKILKGESITDQYQYDANWILISQCFAVLSNSLLIDLSCKLWNIQLYKPLKMNGTIMPAETFTYFAN